MTDAEFTRSLTDRGLSAIASAASIRDLTARYVPFTEVADVDVRRYHRLAR